jgi:hypothetical protein
MSSARWPQFCCRKETARMRPYANAAPMRTTAWRWQRPHSICAYMLRDASSHSTAAAGLVWPPPPPPPRLVGAYGGRLLNWSLWRRLVVTVHASRPPGVVVPDLTK